jgi:AcrR family transcriptional regulator
MAQDPCDSVERARRRGRPVQIDPERRVELVLNATATLLSGRSLGDVTVSDIAAAAGMSKRTIYAMFDTREALLSACFTRIHETILRPLDPQEQALPLPERLRLLLTLHKPKGMESTSLEWLRSIVAQARTNPDLARPGIRSRHLLLARICAELRRECDGGGLDLTDEGIEECGAILMDMAFENALTCLLDPQARPGPETRDRRRDLAIAIFLDGIAGYRPPDGSGT